MRRSPRIAEGEGSDIRWIAVGVLTAILAITRIVVSPAAPAAAQSPPTPTQTHYIQDISCDPNQMSTTSMDGIARAEGATGAQGIVVLNFGQPAVQSGVYGANLVAFTNPFVSVSQIESAVECYALAYYGTTGPSITIAVGTTNFVGTQGQVNALHGGAWATLVSNIQSYVISNGLSSKITVAGANDIEPGFSSATAARSWVNGFAAVPGFVMINYGSCDGCPTTLPVDWALSCPANNGWTCEDIWYVSWGNPAALALPEIYFTGLAAQWKTISLYAVAKYSQQIIYSGSLTQNGACTQKAGTMFPCPPNWFTAAQGWTDFNTALNTPPGGPTSQTLPDSSDIRYQVAP